MPEIMWPIATAVAVLGVALAAWDGWRRWLHRTPIRNEVELRTEIEVLQHLQEKHDAQLEELRAGVQHDIRNLRNQVSGIKMTPARRVS